MPWGIGRFTRGLEGSFLSCVDCISTFWVSVVSGEQDCYQCCLACLGQPPLLTDCYLGGNLGDVVSRGHSHHENAEVL